jgi:hypothetical protein
MILNHVRRNKRMTNEEAIKEIQDASDYEVRHGDIEHHHEDIMRRVEAFEQAVNALQKCKTWIPVSERLPEENGGYLVTVKRGYVTTALWLGDAEKWSAVTAWMPLPKPYKGGEINGKNN